MPIQLGGLVSGFDTESLIRALISRDTKPLDLMAQKKTRLEDAQNAWKDVNMRLTNLRNMVNLLKNSDTFSSKVVNSSNDKILSVSAGSSAANGTYQLKVHQLAEFNRYATASAADITGDDEANDNTVLGLIGTFSLRSSDSTEDALITVEVSDSLRDISNKINAANVGVTASLVENRLVIKSNTMGERGAIMLPSTGDAPVLASLLLNQTTAAQDARIEFEGLEFTRSSNYISDLVQGVTLNLTGTSDDAYVYFTVSSDTTRATDAIRGFVDQYNSLLNFIEEKTFLNPGNGALLIRSRNYTPLERGILQGDPTVTNLSSQLRRMVSSSLAGFNPMLNSLSAIGINTVSQGLNKKQVGYLAIDEAKLARALADPTGPATISTREQMPVQFNAFNSKTLEEITGDSAATANRTELGLAGVFEIQTGNGSFKRVSIEATDTLNVIRNKINAAAAGVTASVQDNRLVITSNTMGQPGQITFMDTNTAINSIIGQIAHMNNEIAIADSLLEPLPAVEYNKLVDTRNSLLARLSAYGEVDADNLPRVEFAGKEVINPSNSVTSVTSTDIADIVNGLIQEIADINLIIDGQPIPPNQSDLDDRDAIIEQLKIYGSVKFEYSTSNEYVFETVTFLGQEVINSVSNVVPVTDTYLDSLVLLDPLGLREVAIVSDANNAIKADQSGSFTMVINGKNFFIELNGPMTSQEVVRQINTVIGSEATASLDRNNRLTFTTIEQGWRATITIKDVWEGKTGDLATLGLIPGSSARGKDLDSFFTASIPATQATVISKQPLGFNPVTGSGGKLVVNIDNREFTVDFVGNYNRGDIANHINKTIGEYGQAYLDDNNFLIIRSLKSGDGSSVRIVSFDQNLTGLNLTTGQSATAEKGIDGIAVVLDRFYEAWVKSNGLLTQKDNALTGQIRDIQKQMDNLTARIDAKVERLWKQFSYMETRLQDMNSQSQTIDMYLANLMNSMRTRY